MPENWPVKSDYNSKWVIGALTEAKEVWGFDLKMLKKLCSLGRFRSYKKSLFMGRMYTPTLYAQRVKGIIIHLRKTVYKNVYLHVNLTLLKVKTKNKYNQSLLSHANSFSISSVSVFQNFIIQLFPTTNLWVHLVKLSTEHVSNISLATPKWFQDKIQKNEFFNLRK